MRTAVVAVVAAVALAAAPGATAGVKRAESILPPGNSGFVSLTGLASGTGSPHLYDQQQSYIDFERKPALFDAAGDVEIPRPGVQIVRDAFGVPAITAGNENEAWWGAGYAVAQDRLFQLELFKRATSGRLAEIVGPSFLDDDLIARRDYYTDAEVQGFYEQLSPIFRARFEAYRDGINAWIAHVRTSPADLPGEFAATAAPLRDWTVLDSVRVGIFLARTVPSGDGEELANLRALRELGGDAFGQLLPLRTPGAVPTVPVTNRRSRFPSQPGRTAAHERRAFRRSVQAAEGMPLPGPAAAARARPRVAPGLIGQAGGSYMFAVRRDGDRHALLFNGPQLGFSVPELFWELELHAPGYDVRGVTAAGVPLVGIGHNGKVAWGFTSGLSDEDDLYAEDVVAGQPETYRFRGEERRMDCRDEVFEFRSPPSDLLGITSGDVPEPSAGSRTERICRTVHGPVQARVGETAYARRYAVWGRELETLTGLDLLNRAQDIGDVDRAMDLVSWNENVMAADSQGNIGYWHPGLFPLRPAGFDERLPYPGTGEAEWRGFLARDRTPQVVNPKQGYLIQWNNVPSVDWTAGDGPARERLTGVFHRANWLKRLVRKLRRDPTWEGAERAVFQAGTIAQQRPLARDRLRRAAERAPGAAGVVLDTLLRWDGSYDRTDDDGLVSAGVATWETFKDEAERIALAKLGGLEEAEGLAGETSTSHEFDISNGEAYALRTLTPREYRSAAIATLTALEERFKSSSPDDWRTRRLMYDVSAQGAGSAPPLPFFDRGTWEQLVEVGP